MDNNFAAHADGWSDKAYHDAANASLESCRSYMDHTDGINTGLLAIASASGPATILGLGVIGALSGPLGLVASATAFVITTGMRQMV